MNDHDLSDLGELEREGRSTGGRRQLDLFEAPAPPPAEEQAVLDTLREVDVDRLTPLDALQLVASLKRMAQAK